MTVLGDESWGMTISSSFWNVDKCGLRGRLGLLLDDVMMRPHFLKPQGGCT